MNAYGQSWNYQSYKHETNSNNKHYQPERQKNILKMTKQLDEQVTSRIKVLPWLVFKYQ